jgi:hypothetical protein
MNIMTGVFIMVAVASLVHAWKISKKLSWLEGFEAAEALRREQAAREMKR